MKRRTILIVVAVVLALGAAGLVYWYTGTVKKQAGVADDATRYVLVAREDIPARTSGAVAVQKGMAEAKAVPESLIAPGALTNASALDGKVFTGAVAKGQQIVSGLLGDPEQQSLSYEIQAGMRAVAIPIDRLRGVGGTPRVGDRVDVYATFTRDELCQAGLSVENVLPVVEQGADGELVVAQPVAMTTTNAANDEEGDGTNEGAGGLVSSITKVLLQQVEVLAIDQLEGNSGSGVLSDSGEDAPKNPVVVLMIAPEDVERLVFAQEIGTLWLALVPAEDAEQALTPGRILTNIFR